MRLLNLLLGLQALLGACRATDDGLTDVVQWDHFSLVVNGERVIIMSGEFHYQRLPVPELWLDVFQKFKANGMNALSIYFFWSYHSASKGVYDFTSPAKDVQFLLDAAKEAGLYVVARPGPYCNAETNGGGLALWTSDGSGGKLRTSDETYHNVWEEWVEEVGAILERNQITNGGPVIMLQVENELQETTYSANNTLVEYMEQLETAWRDAGIVVPLSHNEKGMRSKSWSTDYNDVGGAVNVYGLDSYPGGLSCTNPDTGFSLVRTYYQWFQNVSYTQPEYLPEFEGGYFQPWGGYFYDQCQEEHSPEFADVYYKDVVAQKVTLLSLYMTFGGTNWGHSAAPVVYTSYDYSSPLRETREVQDKFKQFKLLGLFTRVSKGLQTTNMESNGSGNAVDNAAIWTWVLKNPDTGSRFYLAENNNSASRAVTNFTLTADTSAGPIAIPNLQLNGRQSRWVVTDYSFGNETLLYSSAELVTYGIFDRPVLVFYLQEGQTGEFAFKSTSRNITFVTYGAKSDIVGATAGNSTSKYAKFVYTQSAGATVVSFSNSVLVYLLDMPSSYSFFAPPTTTDPNVQPDQQIFVLGPYLVRSANVKDDTVKVVGDNANSTTIEVYVGDHSVRTISWNGQALKTSVTPYGSLQARISGTEDQSLSLPTLSGFKSADSLPEISPTYDDSKWVVANKTTTLNPVKPITLPVLYSSDYGYYVGAKLYRAYFTGNATSANITVQGGLAAGWSAWLNGKLVGGHPGNASLTVTSSVLDITGVVSRASGNVLTVATDYNGHDETSTGPDGVENPRGILGATLVSGSGSNLSYAQWKIQGNAGGSANIDPVRGPMNEGGLYGERLGWHLPGFDTSDWALDSPLTGLNQSGIRWYTTTFSLDIDSNLDAPLGVELGAPAGTVARVMLFVNGYQFGKFLPHIGPQTRFPVPPGIINTQGKNTLSISLWAQNDTGAKLSTLQLFSYATYQSGFGFGDIDGKRLQPAWTDRSAYA